MILCGTIYSICLTKGLVMGIGILAMATAKRLHQIWHMKNGKNKWNCNRFIIKSFLLHSKSSILNKSEFDVGFHAVSASKSYKLRVWAHYIKPSELNYRDPLLCDELFLVKFVIVTIHNWNWFLHIFLTFFPFLFLFSCLTH